MARPLVCRAARRRALLRLAAVAVLLRSAPAHAAAYVPGSEGESQQIDEPVPEAPAAAPAPAGRGLISDIEWRFAPPLTSGTLSFDLRTLRQADGSRTSQALVYNDLQAATYLWQPWFVQLRAGVGALAERDSARSAGAEAVSGRSTALTGRFSLAVFPASRFPFELAAEVGDSRVRGDTLGTDYRSRRISLSQAWRPETGNDSVHVDFDHSRLRLLPSGLASGVTNGTSAGGDDTVTSLRASVLREFAAHSWELSGQVTRNQRSESDETSRFANLNARHTFHPASALHVDTLASWNDVSLHSATTTSRLDSSTDLRQLSTFATWRPAEGDWFYSARSPLYLTGSARFLQASTTADANAQQVRALNASLGLSQDLTREWRWSGAVSGTQVEPADGARTRAANGTLGLSWAHAGVPLGGWRYSPSLAANLGVSRASGVDTRNTVGLQFAHGVTRSVVVREADSVSMNLTQSLGTLHDSQTRTWSHAIAHSAGVYWQGAADGASQSYASLSASDSRTREAERGKFQLVNVQVSRRQQLTRLSSTAGNLTWQSSRSDASTLDPFTGERRSSGTGWQRFYSGSASYEHQRAFDVPRLRYSALLSVNSQQLETRAAGDIDAPLQRVTASLENRLDYAIGRLEARLAARVARVDGRGVASVFARVQRRY